MPKVHIPGPWLAKFTVLPLVLRQALRRNFDGLHGPHSVVQTGPRRVSVNDARGLRDVFLSAPVRRLDRYPNLVFLHNYAAENIISTVDGDTHHDRRRIVQPSYAATLAVSEELKGVVSRAAEGFLALREREQGQRPLGNADVKPLLRLALADIMSHVVYGRAHETNTLRDPEQRSLLQKDADFHDWRISRSASSFFALLFPDTTLWLRKNLGWSPRGHDITLINRPHTDKLGRAALLALQHGRTTVGACPMERMYRHLVENGPTPAVPSLEYILSDCVDHFWAGVNTPLDPLVALLKKLDEPQNGRIRQKLEAELGEAALPHGGSPFDIPATVLSRLPLLDAVIRETLRLYPPVPFGLERRVTKREGGIIVGGHFIPAGWIVGAAPETLHRRPDIFAQPGEWRPERWLAGGDGATDEARRASLGDMKRHFYAFGAGPRMCIGVNVAWTAMRGLVAGIYGRPPRTSMRTP
ncbi:cytochrome P450 [Plectosphaerella cucumerina]|uniref:Cytochrome P450 n=1 Tax=Plectosphaerella cucumerina TaxID=40658 RepID=A0A8K0X744_9PEZI|nr:cytochrome P450 [Plectosphaerella cucumerina]